ncbi:MAG: hypothetical protein F6K36_01675 [Symploca sp. SIO3C6]|uniref:Uncharacterized protein n=1 Tax=Symploca sp. SIO1C4 TaxID=2607765 RepID=A0A6B3NFF5_9CYAN|nr:hypothetical protein [Symploca sp. SIO3C6]NER30360.1 hypothetical protein [Symploca sp. SIO1C4]NET04704.1 hypothetical protein [Symploca sp. SIO2B6]
MLLANYGWDLAPQTTAPTGTKLPSGTAIINYIANLEAEKQQFSIHHFIVIDNYFNPLT